MSHTVTKRELVQRIADQTGQTKVLVRDVIQLFLDEVANELIAGNRLEFRKFGVFIARAALGVALGIASVVLLFAYQTGQLPL